MRIAVIGTGYVGLVTGACFAERGNEVTCVDIDEEKVKLMQSGQVPIYEPGLEELFKTNMLANSLQFTTNLAEGIQGAEVIFLALPTPAGEDGAADLSYILGAASDIGSLLDSYVVIVDKSTVPVGTAEKVRETIGQKTNVEFDLVSNPEFLKEGFAIEDFMNPDRVIIGVESNRAQKIMAKLYEPFIDDPSKFIAMDLRSAEMTKYAANAFLATKISFINEIANLCEKVGADVDAVRVGIGSDQRIGHRFLYPGIGYGGSCFPKDVQALQKTAHENDDQLEILQAVVAVNDKQKSRLIYKLREYYGDLKGKHFALWGLAFKANTDDIREAPALEIIRKLLDDKATVTAYDPEATDNVKKYFGEQRGLSYSDDKYDALKGADGLLIATEWDEFKEADTSKVKSLLNESIVFDGRNVFNPSAMRGFKYYEGVGRLPLGKFEKRDVREEGN